MKRFKKILPIGLVLALLLVLVPMPVLAAEATITVSGDSTVIAVTVSPTTWSIGTIAQGSTHSTFVEGVQGYFTVTNTGNCLEDMSIKGTDASGTAPAPATWTLAAAPGSDTYTIGWGQATTTTNPYDTESTYTSKLTTSYAALTSSLAINGTYLFDLQLKAPTTITVGATDMTATVTILAVVAA